jgi:hypothetical protein
MGASFNATRGVTAVQVYGIQATGVNVADEPIKRIDGQIICPDRQHRPLYLVRDGQIVSPSELVALPRQHTINLTMPLSFDGTNQNQVHIDDIEFLDKYAPFVFTLNTNIGSEQHEFTLEMCQQAIGRVLDQGRSEGPIWRTA